jgi:hypothetical protein
LDATGSRHGRVAASLGRGHRDAGVRGRRQWIADGDGTGRRGPRVGDHQRVASRVPGVDRGGLNRFLDREVGERGRAGGVRRGVVGRVRVATAGDHCGVHDRRRWDRLHDRVDLDRRVARPGREHVGAGAAHGQPSDRAAPAAAARADHRPERARRKLIAHRHQRAVRGSAARVRDVHHQRLLAPADKRSGMALEDHQVRRGDRIDHLRSLDVPLCPRLCPEKLAPAWLTIGWPFTSAASILTSNVTVSVSPVATDPPLVAVAPEPSRNTT